MDKLEVQVAEVDKANEQELHPLSLRLQSVNDAVATQLKKNADLREKLYANEQRYSDVLNGICCNR